MSAAFPLNEFRVIRPISPGSFGAVYAARWEKRGIDVALKRIPPTGEDAAAKQKAEQRGAEIQSQFWARHRALVPEVYCHGFADTDEYCIAMEVVHGQSLRRLPKPVVASVTVPIAIGIGEFLEKLHGFEVPDADGHATKLVHADLKPEHVHVVADGIRVLDFGISKQLQTRKSYTVNLWASFPYASPEQAARGEVSVQSDLWAFGVILYELLAGHPPYRRPISGDPHELRRAVLERAPIPPLVAIDSDLGAIVMKMLCWDKQGRYQSAIEVTEDLRRYLRGERPTALDVPTLLVPAPGSADAFDVPTDPVPALVKPPRQTSEETWPLPASASPAKTQGQTVPASKGDIWNVARRTPVLRALRIAGTAVALAGLLLEASAWIRAERFRSDIEAIETNDIPSLGDRLKDVRGWSPIALALPLRVHGPLTDRLLQLSLRPTLEFRTDSPNVTKDDWEKAARALVAAQGFGSGDRSIQAQRQYVGGHLARIAGQAAGASADALFDDAERAFLAASELDPTSYDPFLGLARLHAYDRPDFAALLRDIQSAESRGYHSGRRERAEVGDAFRRRANRTRVAAQRLPFGPERRRQLLDARADYQNCVAKFAGLNDYLDSNQSLAQCSLWFRRLSSEVEQ